MKKLMMVAAATVAAWSSWGAERISVKAVANHYPWDGKVDCVYTLSGTVVGKGYVYDGVFELSVKKDGETFRRVVTNDLTKVDGTYTNTFDCTALFGAGYYPNGGISVELVKKLDGVQLWADGPYFATRNVGALQPEEPGYHFWWGDPVGFTFDSSKGWCAVDGSETGFQFSADNTKIVTNKKSLYSLTNNGYVDSDGNLAATRDAATVQWGTLWRIPTKNEMNALVSNCTTNSISNWKGTGVAGMLYTGKGDYASKSIFIPYAGAGVGSEYKNLGKGADYWSSTLDTGNSSLAWCLNFGATLVRVVNFGRYEGRCVRPLRVSAE